MARPPLSFSLCPRATKSEPDRGTDSTTSVGAISLALPADSSRSPALRLVAMRDSLGLLQKSCEQPSREVRDIDFRPAGGELHTPTSLENNPLASPEMACPDGSPLEACSHGSGVAAMSTVSHPNSAGSWILQIPAPQSNRDAFQSQHGGGWVSPWSRIHRRGAAVRQCNAPLVPALTASHAEPRSATWLPYVPHRRSTRPGGRSTRPGGHATHAWS
jgi:hypothetical protein